MTSRTRKLTVGVAVAMMMMALILVFNRSPPIAVAIADYDGRPVSLQITNLAEHEVQLVCVAIYPNPGMHPPEELSLPALKAGRAIRVPIPSSSYSAAPVRPATMYVRCQAHQSGIKARAARFLDWLGIRPPWRFQAEVNLPPPQLSP